jgi:hypothetical protein
MPENEEEPLERQSLEDTIWQISHEKNARVLRDLLDYAPTAAGRANVIEDILDNIGDEEKLDSLYKHYWSMVVASE